MLNYTLVIIKLAAIYCIIFGLLGLLPTINFAFVISFFNLNVALLLGFLLRFMLPTYLKFFYVLYKRRNYEFRHSHACKEIPLALAIMACVIVYIFNKLISSVVILMATTQFFVY